MLESPLLPNLLYLILVAGLWLAALSVASPGSGFYELLALLALVAAGVGASVVPMNAWALAPIALGMVVFVISIYGVTIWKVRQGMWLVLSALLLTVGSAFLFRSEGGGPAVNPVLAFVTAIGSVSFFWVVVRSVWAAQQAEPTFDPTHVIGQLGEARTSIDPIGSAYVGGELWTVRSNDPIPQGSVVRVVKRDGLVLIVSPEGQPQGGEKDD